MFEGDYSKKVWIITIVMAVCSIGLDIFFLMNDNDFMKQTVWFSMLIAAFILYKGIEGLIKKIKEEKDQ